MPVSPWTEEAEGRRSGFPPAVGEPSESLEGAAADILDAATESYVRAERFYVEPSAGERKSMFPYDAAVEILEQAFSSREGIAGQQLNAEIAHRINRYFEDNPPDAGSPEKRFVDWIGECRLSGNGNGPTFGERFGQAFRAFSAAGKRNTGFALVLQLTAYLFVQGQRRCGDWWDASLLDEIRRHLEIEQAKGSCNARRVAGTVGQGGACVAFFNRYKEGFPRSKGKGMAIDALLHRQAVAGRKIHNEAIDALNPLQFKEPATIARTLTGPRDADRPLKRSDMLDVVRGNLVGVGDDYIATISRPENELQLYAIALCFLTGRFSVSRSCFYILYLFGRRALNPRTGDYDLNGYCKWLDDLAESPKALYFRLSRADGGGLEAFLPSKEKELARNRAIFPPVLGLTGIGSADGPEAFMGMSQPREHGVGARNRRLYSAGFHRIEPDRRGVGRFGSDDGEFSIDLVAFRFVQKSLGYEIIPEDEYEVEVVHPNRGKAERADHHRGRSEAGEFPWFLIRPLAAERGHVRKDGDGESEGACGHSGFALECGSASRARFFLRRNADGSISARIEELGNDAAITYLTAMGMRNASNPGKALAAWKRGGRVGREWTRLPGSGEEGFALAVDHNGQPASSRSHVFVFENLGVDRMAREHSEARTSILRMGRRDGVYSERLEEARRLSRGIMAAFEKVNGNPGLMEGNEIRHVCENPCFATEYMGVPDIDRCAELCRSSIFRIKWYLAGPG